MLTVMPHAANVQFHQLLVQSATLIMNPTLQEDQHVQLVLSAASVPLAMTTVQVAMHHVVGA